MSDHFADIGKMVPDKVVMLRTIAAVLDHPNVYMGGPSQRNMRRAEEILAAVAPLIAAAERERCARVAEQRADDMHEIAAAAQDEGDQDRCERMMYRGIGAKSAAAAIRAMGDADE